jgi:hypothetical protein
MKKSNQFKFKAMKRNFLMLCISVSVFLFSSISLTGQGKAGKLEGTWSMNTEGSDLNFEFATVEKNNDGRMTTSVVINKSDLTDFTYGNDISFSLKKTSGDILMKGNVTKDGGNGTFTFTPNESFVKSLEDEGLKGLSSHVFLLFTLKNTDLKFVKNIKSLGYGNLSENDLVPIIALDISVEYIKEIQNSGFKDISLSKIISFKALKIDPAYIASMKKLSDGDLSDGDIISFAALKVDEKYAEEMYKSGYKLTGQNLIQFKAMGITPEYVKGIKASGVDEISQDDIVQLKAQNVTPDYIREVRDMGFREKISASTIVKLKIFKINKEYVDQIKSAGYSDLPADKLVEFSIFKIDKAFIEKATQFVGSKPTVEKLIQLRIAEGNAPN